jgi:colanic acid biosynthesis glycosyl transferase WcaI
MGRMDANSSTARLLYAVERFIYRRTDVITVICGAFERAIQRKPTKPNAVELIPNFVDPDEIQPGEKRNPLSEELGLVDKFVVLYAGNLGQTQSFDTLLTVAEQLRDKPEIHFLIVGGGTRQEYIERTIEEQNLQNVTLLPYQPRSRVPEIYATCDVGLVPLMRGTAETTLPSKLYTIMSSGRAVFAAVDADSDIVETVRDANCGVTLPPDDAAALREAILAGWADQAKLKQYGENGRQHALAHFSRQSVSGQYDALIRLLTR